MAIRRGTIIRTTLVAAALALAAPLVGPAPPAAAAAGCWSAGTNGSYASANCSGSGYARVVARCNAIWPFSPWTDYGSWVWVGGGTTIVNPHVQCGASMSVWVQYR